MCVCQIHRVLAEYTSSYDEYLKWNNQNSKNKGVRRMGN
jgi:hypothetical protein